MGTRGKKIKNTRKRNQTQRNQTQRNQTQRNPPKRGGGGGKDEPSSQNYSFQIPNYGDKGNHTPVFGNDPRYNLNIFLRESHNCYTYFLDLQSKDAVELCKQDFKHNHMCRRAQPGMLSGFPRMSKKDYNCPEIESRTISDNPEIYKVKTNKIKCDPDFYKGAMVVAPGRDYHYYRYNDDGIWTHKPGYKPSTKYDANNNLIIDPKWASRDYGGTLNYKQFCGYYCIPRNKERKDMNHLSTEERQEKNSERKEWNNHDKLLKKLKVKKTNNTRKVIGKKVAYILSER
jgi:hypothetical protein